MTMGSDKAGTAKARFCLLGSIFILLLCGPWIPIRASADTVIVMKTADRAEIKESPDEASETVLEVEQGTPLLIMGESGSDWYQVQYQGVAGYLGKEHVVPYIDEAELGQEFAALEQDFQGGFEQILQHQKQKWQDRIWQFIIVMMAAAIAVLSIYALIRGRRSEEDDKKHTADAGKDEKPVS